MKNATVRAMLAIPVMLFLATQSHAAELTTGEEIRSHLIAHSPYNGEFELRNPNYGLITTGDMTATFTATGGRLTFKGRPHLDADIVELNAMVADGKPTVTFKSSTTGAIYTLNIKGDKLMGIAQGIHGTSRINLSQAN